MQILSSSTGLLIVPRVGSTYKLLLSVHYETVVGLTKYIRQTTKRHHTSYAFLHKCLKDWKSNRLYKTCQMELPGEQVQKKIWKTDGPEVITCLRHVRLLAKSAYDLRHVRPSLCLRLNELGSHWTDFHENVY